MYLLIDRLDPEAHVKVVSDLLEEHVMQYHKGLIDIFHPETMQRFAGSWDCPGWEPLPLEAVKTWV